MFEESYLWHVTKLPELKLSAQLVDKMINKSIICQKHFEAWFKVNERFTRFGMAEFALIASLKFGELPKGSASNSILEKTWLWDKMFTNRERITCSNLEKVSLKYANHNDLYKLELLLIIEEVFNSWDRNVGIHLKTLFIVDGLDFFNVIPWGTVF